MCHEGMYKLDNLFKTVVTNTFISFGKSGQLVLACGRMPFLNMLGASLEF